MVGPALSLSLLLLLLPLALCQHVNLSAEPPFLPEHEREHQDDAIDRRSLAFYERLQKERPVAIRKMSSDPGEKFYLDYWLFADDVEWTNLTSALLFHTEEEEEEDALLSRLFNPRLLSKRDYQCPTGTYSCASIDRPNSCCSTGSTCQIVTDTGLGDVGCCPSGETCGGDLSSCSSDYTSCSGGGCCMAGYACSGVGCVQTNTSTVVVVPSTTQSQAEASSTVVVTSTVWVTPSVGSPVVVTSTYVTVVIPTVATSSTTTTVTTTPSSTAQASQPVLPTSQISSTTTTTSTASTTSFSSVSGCPTGFYACSAYYDGGCCQVDRDCDSTSCPTRASTTVVDTDSVTAVAGTGSGITAVSGSVTGTCASYWTLCGTDVSGGCCPSGYSCGASACTATQSAGESNTVAKEAPSAAFQQRIDWIVLVVSLMTAVVYFYSM